MFSKKKCKDCGEKINDAHSYCPYCGAPQKKNKEQGMLGDNDYEEQFGNISNSLFGGFSEKMFSKMFESAMKIIEKEMTKEMNKKVPKNEKDVRSNFELFINGKRVNLENMNPQYPVQQKPKEKIESARLPQNILKGFSGLPKKEPLTNVRRISDKVVYEVKLPGVKSEKDLSVTKLENNIEIKAKTKEKAYHKFIPVSLPIIAYAFSKGKLTLELDTKE